MAAVGLLAMAHAAGAGMVRTKAGQVYRGKAMIVGDALVVEGAEKNTIAISDVAEADLKPDTPPPATAPAMTEPTGLTLEFFNTFNLGRPILRQIEPNLNFEWAGAGPDPAIGSPSYTARWTGALVAPKNGKYTLYWRANPGSRLWLDGKLLVDQWMKDSWKGATLPVELQKGPHDLRVDFIQSWNAPFGKLEWSGEAMPQQMVPTSAFRPTPVHVATVSAGTGLLGEYFSDREFKKRRTTRRDEVIDFAWLNSTPDPSMRDQNISMRWTGQIEPAYSEQYTFHLESAERTRLWIGGEEIKMERVIGGDPQRPERRGTAMLKAGQKIDIRVECVPNEQMKPLALSWSSSSQAREVVPRDRLYPPANFGRVVRALELTGLREFEEMPEAAEISLTAKMTGGEGEAKSLVFLDRGQEVAKAEKIGQPAVWKKASPGWHLMRAQVTEADGSVTQSPPVPFHIVQADLPAAPWRWSSIGKPWIGREARMHGAALEVHTGEGRVGSESEEDAFEFVSQELRGDGEIVAHVKEIAPEGSTTAAGVMIRDGASGVKRKLIFAGYTAGNFIVAPRGNEVVIPPIAGPSTGWVKISRYGPRITIWSSQDGREYKRVASMRMELPPTVSMGLAVVGANVPKEWSTVPAGRAKYDNIALTVKIAEQDSPAGLILLDGSRLAGKLESWDAQQIALLRPDGTHMKIATDSVARIQVQPVDADLTDTLTGKDVGVMTQAGDFVEGVVRPADNGSLVTVDSLEFGLQRFNDREASTVVLRKAGKPTGAEVRLADGSALRVKTIREDKGRVKITTTGSTEVEAAADQVWGFTAADGK